MTDSRQAQAPTRRIMLTRTAGLAAAVAAGSTIGGALGANTPAEAAGAMPVFSVVSFGAKGDGSTDDTTAIMSAINAAQANQGGGVVSFPTGVYAVSAPLVVTGSDIYLQGTQGLATMGGAGNNDDSGTTIKPLSSWARGSAAQPACILFDASAKSINRGGVERVNIDGGNLSSSVVMHGIATYGSVGAWSATGCIVSSISSNSSIGINQITGSSGTTAQGSSTVRNLVQSVGGGGFNLAPGDATIEHCHAQGCGGNGFSITGSSGGDTRISNCRGDLSQFNGFYINVPAGEFLGMVQISNCSTQRNGDNGIKIANTGYSPPEICPVYLSNCVFQGDGTTGGSNAGIRLSGPVAAVITGCGVLVDTVDVPGGCPAYAITTASDSVSPPVMVQMSSGFYNSVTAFANKINAPLASDVRVFVYTNPTHGQWSYDKTPVLVTSL
jgi:hypothetical protein